MAFDLPPQIAEFVGRLLTRPLDELGRGQLALRHTLDLVLHCARKLDRDRAREMAAALTYHTLFSLLPMLAVSLSVLALFTGPEERRRFEERVLDLLLPPAVISLAPLSEEAGASTGAAASKDERRLEFEEARREVGQRVDAVLSSLEGVSFRGIGLVGLLVFIYASTALLASVETSFNAIFGSDSSRPWYVRLPTYYTVITLGPLALVGGLTLQSRALEWLATERLTAWLAGPIFVLSPLVSAWLMLFLMFVLLPTARVARGPAAIGSLVSAMLWVLAKELFGSIVTAAYAQGTAARIYGSLALLLLFLLWLWLTWIIILFGLELTATIQALHGGGLDHLPDFGESEGLMDVRWVLPLAATVAARFAKGESANTDQLAANLGLPRRPVRQLLEALEEADILIRVEDGPRAGWTLARPAASVKVAELFTAARPLLPTALTDRATARAFEWAEALPKAAQDASLADLLPE